MYSLKNINYNCFRQNNYDLIFINNNVKKNLYENSIDVRNDISLNNAENTNSIHNIFFNVINHILLTKPFFINIKNFPLKKIELSYLKNELIKKGYDLNVVLEGCMDCLKDLNI